MSNGSDPGKGMMNAEGEIGGWGWMAARGERLREKETRSAKRPRRRRHADWILELGLMLVLAALLPRGPRRQDRA